jgi:DNA repair exonuclease SbcCD nuclease subunit
MKVALFADLHIHPYIRFASISVRGFNSWVESALDVLEQIYQECKRRDITTVYCLGDLFHVGVRLYTRTFIQVYEFFSRQKQEQFCTHLVAGNHDLVARGSTECILSGLRDVVSYVLVGQTYFQPGIEFLLVPYVESYESLMVDVKKMKPRVILGHLAVEGAVVGVNEFQPKEGISSESFDGLELVALGHYHKQQTVRKKDPRVVYIGSAMSLDFHDSGEQKGFMILDTESLELEFVPIRSVGFTVLRGAEVGKVNVKDQIVRIDHAEEVDEERVRCELVAQGARAVVFNRTAVKEIELRTGNPDATFEDCLSVYVERNAGGLDKSRLLSLGREIVQECEQ